MTIAPERPVTALPPVPEAGQVVSVRGSAWAVTEVRRQGLPRSPADEEMAGLNHVVYLQSLEEDRLGEELAIVWELEVGHSVAPDQGLPETVSPEAFDDPNTLAAFVDAVRWGAVTSADPNSYQAPFRSGANVEAYQLEPLRRALQSSRTNLLLADDVGLGKTIEAGLVIQELLLRHRARSVVIVCPPSLSLKWQDEMREKFGLDFVIVNSELLAQVRRSHGQHANPFRLFPRVIVSMSWLPGMRAQRLLRDIFADVSSTTSARRYAFDVLAVDEAHHVAPARPMTAPGGRGYAIDSARTLATRALADKCEHRLFLSATPHNGYSESFTALLEMIDSRRFSRGASLDERALGEITVRRLKADLPEKDFKPRQLRQIPFSPGADEQDMFALLDRILVESARSNGEGRSGGIAAMLLKKRFLSSPWSFARTLELYQQTAEDGRQIRLDDEGEYYREVLGSGQSDEEEGETDQPEFTALRRSRAADPLATATGQEITRLIEWGSRFEHRPDARLEALVTFLDAICRPDGTTWTNERVVVFTEYAATLDWIARILDQRGYRGVLATIQGSTPADERELIRAQFTARPTARQDEIRVLLATDSAGEGIDLQDYCHRLVNFDIPFNPSRLEQRIGRIDRYGQEYPPEIFQFVPAGTTSKYEQDTRFLVDRIAMKIGTVAADLGSVNQVIDAEVRGYFSPGAGTDRPSADTGGPSAPRSGQSRAAAPDDGAAVINRALAGGIALNRQLTELSASYEDRKAQMHLTPANARRVVDAALALTGQPPLLPGGNSPEDAGAYTVPALGSAWQSALRGLDTRLNPGVPRDITFDAQAARDAKRALQLDDHEQADDAENELVYIHLGHALMQRSARILRSALFSADSPVNRVTAVVVEDLPQSCVAAVSRLVLVGRGGLRLHEEVFLTGIRLRGNAMAEAKVEQVLDAALDAQGLTLASMEIRTALARLYNADGSRLRTRLLTAMATRAQARQEARTSELDSRRKADIQRAQQIFAAFRLNLAESRERLATEIATQDAMLFTDDQQRQRRRDLRAMEDRSLSLDAEERREIAAIGERYAGIRPHVSAAAVVFALTPADAQSGLVLR